MSFAVIEIQSTPNPNARKFILSGIIAPQPLSFLNSEAAQKHPVAQQLFFIKGVTSVLLLGDFVTVNKEPGAKWPSIVKRVQKLLEDF